MKLDQVKRSGTGGRQNPFLYWVINYHGPSIIAALLIVIYFIGSLLIVSGIRSSRRAHSLTFDSAWLEAPLPPILHFRKTSAKFDDKPHVYITRCRIRRPVFQTESPASPTSRSLNCAVVPSLEYLEASNNNEYQGQAHFHLLPHNLTATQISLLLHSFNM